MNNLQELDADYEKKHGRSLTSDDASLDSFVSAVETPDLSDLEVRLLSILLLLLLELLYEITACNDCTI